MKPSTECRIDWCRRERQRDALYCSVHLNDAWAKRAPVVPRWVERMRDQGLPAKDYSAA